MSVADQPELPDGTLVYTPGTGWLGMVENGCLLVLLGGKHNANCAYVPPMRTWVLALRAIERWRAKLEEYISVDIMLPGTPEHDEHWARYVAICLEKSS